VYKGAQMGVFEKGWTNTQRGGLYTPRVFKSPKGTNPFILLIDHCSVGATGVVV
jgi:hypothetical protein